MAIPKRKRTCRVCRNDFQPVRCLQQTCSFDCEVKLGLIHAERSKAKREKAEKEAQHEAKEHERETRDMTRQAEGDAKSSKRDEAMSAALTSLSQGLETVAQAQQTLAESLAKPKTIKFNAEGRPVGIQ